MPTNQADDINKRCGLDGACGEPERKCSIGVCGGGGSTAAQLHMNVSIWNVAQCYQIFTFFKGS